MVIKISIFFKTMEIPLLALALKMMVFYGYHSTDFEVHRNWLSITTSLPMNEWYFFDKSIWTLDYPPLFAYFQALLGYAAISLEYLFNLINLHILDLQMLNIENLEYQSSKTVFFMRSTVLLSEFLFLGYAVHKYVGTMQNSKFLYFAYFFHPGIFIVDHIHFQYNGFLYGILLLSCYYIKTNCLVKGGCLFLILLLLKHIFLYIALGYAVYYLRIFKRPKELILLLVGFVLILLFAFYPFRNQIDQIVARLFPFKRGLVHALWAPNFWALYVFADRILAKYKGISNESMTRGLVGDTVFSILPDITAQMTVTVTLIFFAMFTIKFFQKGTYKAFVQYLQNLALTSFMFGWHVHEKALLLPAVINLMEFEYTIPSFLLQMTSISAQAPLFHRKEDIYLHLLVAIILIQFKKFYEMISNQKVSGFWSEIMPLCQGLLVIFSVLLRQNESFPFLHIMLISVVNAILNSGIFIYLLFT
eukprot:NODE_66_length_25735_cov_0.318497.p4 type:complete len:475 gc:universal NODE_66_length_25735_cov_0.318497:17285-15861(-)